MNSKIIPLRGPDRVRLRPAVIFGSQDMDGAQQAVASVLAIYATEAQLGYCKHLQVRHNGAEITISGDDRGLYLGQGTQNDAIWQNIFCSLDPMPRSAFNHPEDTFRLCGHSHHLLFADGQPIDSIHLPNDGGLFDLCVLQCASRFMDVTAVRNGIQSRLHFCQGHNIGGIYHEPTEAGNGTTLRFELDREVFTETALPQDFFIETLQDFALLSPGLHCTYINEISEQERVFFYPAGIADFARESSANTALPVFYNKIQAFGKERYNRPTYEASVEFAIAFSKSSGLQEHWHNFKRIRQGGSHCQRIEQQISSALQTCFGLAISVEALRKHLVILTVTWCPPGFTVWETSAHQAIQNQLIADMAYDAAGEKLTNYLREHIATLQPMVDAIQQTTQ